MSVTVPNAISLASIPDGSAIVASDHRNNYSAVQVGVNGLIAMFTAAPTKGDLLLPGGAGSWDRLPVGANGQSPVADSAQTLGLKYAYPAGYEIAYAESAAQVSVTTFNNAALAQTLVTTPATVFDGTPYYIEFYAPFYNAALTSGAQLRLWLFDGSSIVKMMGVAETPNGTAVMQNPLFVSQKITPSAATHTYGIRADMANVNQAWAVGAGDPFGTGVNTMMFCRIRKV